MPTEVTVSQEIRKTKNIVEEILSEDERARNNDLWLILQVWQKKQHIKCFIPYNQLNEMISPETITRVRRKIQNDERKLQPTDIKVEVKRRKRERQFREVFS